MEREDSLEETIMGMATQLAEAEDTYIVEDLRSMISFLILLLRDLVSVNY